MEEEGFGFGEALAGNGFHTLSVAELRCTLDVRTVAADSRPRTAVAVVADNGGLVVVADNGGLAVAVRHSGQIAHAYSEELGVATAADWEAVLPGDIAVAPS